MYINQNLSDEFVSYKLISKRLNDVCLFAAPCTVSEEDMRNHNIQLRWSRDEKLYSESGGVMEFMCRYGFEPAPSSPPFRIYCREGKLEYPSCTSTYIATHQ